MIKLYLLYLPLGAYVYLRSYETWAFSSYNDCNDVFTWMAMVSSAVLYLITVPLLLYKGDLAIKVALWNLGGILPFAVYWLTYICKYESFLRNADNKSILIAAIVYAIAIFFSVKYVLKPYQLPLMRKSVKLFFSLLPAGLFIALIVYINYINVGD